MVLEDRFTVDEALSGLGNEICARVMHGAYEFFQNCREVCECGINHVERKHF